MRREAFITPGTRVAPRSCPACRRVVDAVTGTSLDSPSRSVPEPGDVLICAYCSAVLIEQAPPFGLRLATQAEFDTLDPDLQKLARMWKPGGPR